MGRRKGRIAVALTHSGKKSRSVQRAKRRIWGRASMRLWSRTMTSTIESTAREAEMVISIGLRGPWWIRDLDRIRSILRIVSRSPKPASIVILKGRGTKPTMALTRTWTSSRVRSQAERRRSPARTTRSIRAVTCLLKTRKKTTRMVC